MTDSEDDICLEREWGTVWPKLFDTGFAVVASDERLRGGFIAFNCGAGRCSIPSGRSSIDPGIAFEVAVTDELFRAGSVENGVPMLGIWLDPKAPLKGLSPFPVTGTADAGNSDKEESFCI